MDYIPVYQPSLTGKEKEYVNDCIDSTWISSKGSYIQRFENEFARINEVQYATSVSNGTVALHLALLALGISAGDEVIVPTLTYIASVNAIKYTGATPVFVDSESANWQVSVEDIQRKISNKTKAIMCVHLYGHPCDMDPIIEIAKNNNLFVIEDCAEAFGSKYKNKYVGTFGDISTFSFFGNKTITTGEGGMVVTNDKTLYDRCIHFKGQGLAAHRQYWHDVIGYNYRMTNICAAIGLAQLEQANFFIERKRHIAESYKKNITAPVIVHQESKDVFHTYWMVSILANTAEERDELRLFLADNLVETRPLFYPVHTMPMYADKYQKHPVAEDLGWRGINLPSYPSLSDEQVLYICELINKFYRAK